MSRFPFSSTSRCTLTVPELWVAGFDPEGLFGTNSVAWRAVESVNPFEFEVALGVTTIWVSRDLLRLEAQPGQWLRFERRGVNVNVSVDLRTTVRAESRLTSLLELLAGQPGSVLT